MAQSLAPMAAPIQICGAESSFAGVGRDLRDGAVWKGFHAEIAEKRRERKELKTQKNKYRNKYKNKNNTDREG